MLAHGAPLMMRDNVHCVLWGSLIDGVLNQKEMEIGAGERHSSSCHVLFRHRLGRGGLKDVSRHASGGLGNRHSTAWRYELLDDRSRRLRRNEKAQTN